MTSSFSRIIAATLSSIGTLVASFLLWQAYAISSSGVFDPPSGSQRTLSSVTAVSAKNANSGFPALVSLDDILTDVRSSDESRIHSLNLKLELELFEEDGRSNIERTEAGLKDVIIDTIRGQSLDTLNTLSGKLYFKETLISRMNAFLHQPVIRDLHFASFFLQ